MIEPEILQCALLEEEQLRQELTSTPLFQRWKAIRHFIQEVNNVRKHEERMQKACKERASALTDPREFSSRTASPAVVADATEKYLLQIGVAGVIGSFFTVVEVAIIITF